MKNTTLLAVTLISALIVGCKTAPPKVTPLPGIGDSASGLSSSKASNLNTDPLALSGGTTTEKPLDFNLPDGDSLTDREMDRTVFEGQTVYFEYDQANVKVSEASKLDQVAGAFKARGSGFDLIIEGHCDERGTEEYNRSLGERRALSMREMLIKSGIDGQHIHTRTFGKDKPTLVGHDDSAWSKNRRGEFVLVLPKKITTTQNTK